MQNYNGQYLFKFPDNQNVDIDELYNRLLAYIMQQNQQPLLQQQITNLENRFNNYMIINPSQDTDVNNKYKITATQIKDLQEKLSIYISIDSFNNSLLNYLLKNPIQTTPLNQYYTITISQITDLSSKFFTQTQINQILTNYYNKSEIDTTLQNYYTQEQVNTKLIESFNNQIVNYYNKTQINTSLNNYLKTVDYNTQIQNYYNITQINNIIASYYSKSQQDQILADYLKITSFNNTIGNYYDIPTINQRLSLLQPIADMSNYYLKTQIDTQLQSYLKTIDFNNTMKDYIMKSYLDTMIVNYYTKAQSNSLLNNYYDKSTVDNIISQYLTLTQFNTIINDYLKQIDFLSQIDNYYTKTILDLKFKDINDRITLLSVGGSNPDVDLSILTQYLRIDEFNIEMQEYLKVSQFNIEINNYFNKTQINTQLQDYLKIIDYNTSLTNYYIKSQIDTKLQDLKDQLDAINQNQDLDIVNNYYNKTQLETKLSDYLQIVPSTTMTLNSKYNINKNQIIDFPDLTQYMIRQPLTSTPINTNYLIMTSQITDFDLQLTQRVNLFYLKKEPEETTTLNEKYNIEISQVKNLEFQLDQCLKFTLESTQLPITYYIFSYQVRDFEISIKALIANYAEKDWITDNYYNKEDINLQNTLLTNQIQTLDTLTLKQVPSAVTNLHANYRITKSQITDFNDISTDQFLPKTPQSTTYLNSNYMIDDLQVSNNNFNNMTNVTNGSIYLSFYSQESNSKYKAFEILPLSRIESNFTKDYNNQNLTTGQRYLLSFQQTASGSKFLQCINQNQLQLNSSQITDLITSLNSTFLLKSPSILTSLNGNYTISRTQISDLDMQQYYTKDEMGVFLTFFLPTQPTQVTTLDANYRIPASQITGLDTSTFLVSSPSNPIQLNSNYRVSIINLDDGAITNQKLAVNSVGNINIIDGVIGTSKIVNTSITQAKLANSSVGTLQIINGNVTIDKMATGSVSTSQLVDGSVTNAKMAGNSISTSQLVDGSITQVKLAANSVSNTQIIDASIGIMKLDTSMRAAFYMQWYYPKCEFTTGRTGLDTVVAPIGQSESCSFQNNSNQQCVVRTFRGMSCHMISSSGATGNITVSNPSSSNTYYQFDTTKPIYNSASGNGGTYGIHYVNSSYTGSCFDGFSGGVKVTIGIASGFLQTWGNYNNQGGIVSYIQSGGTYTISSDINKKDNIKIKTNYDDQLDRLMKLDIITYSYGKTYQDQIDRLTKQISEETDQEKLQQLKNQLEDIHYQCARTMQGYSYQQLQELGFNYVLADYQIMDNEYLNSKGIDKEKIKKKLFENQQKAIGETGLIPYVIMGMKAMNNKIEKINEKLETVNNAMIQSLAKIDDNAEQTSQKLEDIKNASIVNSIELDSIESMKKELYLLAQQFQVQQQTIKKLQSSNIYLNSQIEQMQGTIDKQNQDIINLKLKTKIV